MGRACLGIVLGACSLLLACSDGVAPPTEPSEGAASARDASRPGKVDAAAPRKDAGKAGKDAGSDPRADGAGGEFGDDPVEDKAGAQLPCAVKAVLDAHCATCHGAEPQFGAPMSLSSAADFHAAAPRAKTPLYEAASDRVQRTGAGKMPPSPQKPLSDKDRDTLLAWFEDKAPSSEDKCAATVAEGEGSTPTTPDEAADCELGFELRASDGRGGKFPIPPEDDHYECFYFNAADSGIDPNTLAVRLA